jgi:hypothetical protein
VAHGARRQALGAVDQEWPSDDAEARVAAAVWSLDGSAVVPIRDLANTVAKIAAIGVSGALILWRLTAESDAATARLSLVAATQERATAVAIDATIGADTLADERATKANP